MTGTFISKISKMHFQIRSEAYCQVKKILIHALEVDHVWAEIADFSHSEEQADFILAGLEE